MAHKDPIAPYSPIFEARARRARAEAIHHFFGSVYHMLTFKRPH